MIPYMIIVLVCLVFMHIWPGMTLWLPEFLYGKSDPEGDFVPFRRSSRDWRRAPPCLPPLRQDCAGGARARIAVDRTGPLNFPAVGWARRAG